MNKKPDLNVFVYGTLKSGYQNHARFCRGVARVEKAHVIDRLYDMGVGYPALELPSERVLASGSSDHLHDLAVQAEFRTKHERWRKLSPLVGGWGHVYGEVLTFRYPAQQFAGLDQLEGFRPGSRSLYQRVLALAAWNGQTEPVWMYVMDDLKGKRRILEGVWT